LHFLDLSACAMNRLPRRSSLERRLTRRADVLRRSFTEDESYIERWGIVSRYACPIKSESYFIGVALQPH
jgi:hypothetical protein